ncbi:phosphatase PAP2 family protein [Actinoplanes friuliensis]|uniref:Phosphoesterase pa-phosphatase-like protein n=1 Tax=Actinoplanes friuliensis DSM 7358 TaxID=1246995 RepID=U5VUT8_9ACTN|nr:phosphatase PAP2 family protein [Actinoplanes friuliensis]AGZ40609.1 phosphoesterase pa-phosphatase-like protein [Actinoplanes friuliensis DSM 7358]
MADFAVQVLKRVLAPIAVLLAVMIGLGLLVTKVLMHVWPLTVEDSVNREFERDRTHEISLFSLIFSTLASTQAVIAVTVLAAIVLRLTLHRWRESIFLCAAVCAQALIFFLTTLVIDRPRPSVDHMDVSPPTSSFPSGHTSASVALYLGLAVILYRLTDKIWLKRACWLLLLIPIGVALGRMYRGMHHPSDVTASFLNGGICVWVMARAILDRGAIQARRLTSARA